MKNLIFLLQAFFCLFLTYSVQGIDPICDLRFTTSSVDCNNSKLYVEIEIRANPNGDNFNLRDQNYRFSINPNAINFTSIAIDQNYLTWDGTTLYDGQNLNGSSFSSSSGLWIISYNIVHNFGPGVLVDQNWLKIGRLVFDVIDVNECPNFQWVRDFPDIYIGYIDQGTWGSVDNLNMMDSPMCDAFYECPSICSGYIKHFTNLSNNYFFVDGVNPAGLTYYWNFGDGTTSTSSSPVHTYSLGGTYLVYVITTNQLGKACIYKKKIYVKKGKPKAPTQETGQLSVLPNPASNYSLVKMNVQSANENVSLSLTNVAGQTVLHQIVNKLGTVELDLSNLAAGLYIVKIETEYGVITKKLIKD